jgi:membrane-bound metal-dependent hydrolase YbcI (DUF457 family)
MHGATHLVTGITAGLGVAALSGVRDPLDVAAYAGLGGLAGLAPDWLQVNIPGASRQLRGTFGHRGFSHWVWSAMLASYLTHTIIGAMALAVLAGWLSHIALDALSNGAPAFWPFGILRIGHIKTGGRTDKFTGGAMLVITILLVVGIF